MNYIDRQCEIVRITVFLLFSIPIAYCDIYVSPLGNDANEGTKISPFETLERARDEIRNFGKRSDSIKITLMPGTYRLSKSFELTSLDKYLIIAAEIPGSVTISGASVIRGKDYGWSYFFNPNEHLGSYVKFNLPLERGKNVTNWPLSFREYQQWPQLYRNGRALQLARWPNENVINVATVSSDDNKVFNYDGKSPNIWDENREIYLWGYWGVGWSDEYIKINGINILKNLVSLTVEPSFALKDKFVGRFIAVNILEELDSLEEYYFDTGNRSIYYQYRIYDNMEYSVLTEPIVYMRDSKQIVFKNIVFEDNCDHGILVKNCFNICFENCTIRNTAKSGIVIEGGMYCGLSSCIVEYTGYGGIELNGGDRKSLVPSCHFVQNSEIRFVGRLLKGYTPGVTIEGVGQRVLNNYIHNIPHSAVTFSGNEHEINFNIIVSVCLDVDDAGAIYCGRDWAMGGCIVFGNYITKLGSAYNYNNWGIYLDDMASGVAVLNNFITNTSAGILVGGGSFNNVSHNILNGCTNRSFVFDDRGNKWASEMVDFPDGIMWRKLSKIPWQSALWQERYEYLSQLTSGQYHLPVNNLIESNFVYGGIKYSFSQSVKDHSRVSDMYFDVGLLNYKFDNGFLSFPGSNLEYLFPFIIGPK